MQDATFKHPTVPQQTRSPRRIAVMPAYNEEASIVSVLERLEPLVDEIVVVDDGSTDRTREVVFLWSQTRSHIRLIFFNRNRGMSAAYYVAFQALRQRVACGELRADDLVLTVDADGQHDPAEVEDLVARATKDGFDAVIARRDLSSYPSLKRFGNWLLSLWASLWAGQRLYDVESGFRVFRLGAILDAIQYYKGYRYSETVEVAVILPNLGYRVSNDLLVPVPVLRSRTRVKDGVIDLLAMPAAWWRVITARSRPHGVPSWAVYTLPTLGILGLILMTVNLLVHPLFLADDSMHNYSHVWYLSQQIFEHARIPLHIDLLDSGRAVMFPYGLPPYLAGAILFRLLGDWAVTLMMAVAVVSIVWSAGLARPVMRDPWFILLFVMNPFFIDAVYSFQFATVWSILFFFLFVWAFEQRRYTSSALLLWLTVSTHPIMGGLAAGLYAAYTLVSNRRQARPLFIISLPVVIALVPIFWMTLLTSALHENSLSTIALSVFDSVTRRGSIILLPFLFTQFAPHIRRLYMTSLACFTVVLGMGVIMATGPISIVQQADRGSYYGAIHRSTDIYSDFFRSPVFESGATYRILEPSEREDGMYRFMKHGAVLANEFFSESTMRRSWTVPQYWCYVSYKDIDYVVMESSYLRLFRYNEGELLDSLVGANRAGVVYSDPLGRFKVYDVRSFAAERSRPKSLSECGVY